MSRNNVVNGDILRGQCFTCDVKCYDRTVVYFGPGAFMKCGKCGSWTQEQLAEAERRIKLDVAAYLATVVPVRDHT